jgi:hypothetical protein
MAEILIFHGPVENGNFLGSAIATKKEMKPEFSPSTQARFDVAFCDSRGLVPRFGDEFKPIQSGRPRP